MVPSEEGSGTQTPVTMVPPAAAPSPDGNATPSTRAPGEGQVPATNVPGAVDPAAAPELVDPAVPPMPVDPAMAPVPVEPVAAPEPVEPMPVDPAVPPMPVEPVATPEPVEPMPVDPAVPPMPVEPMMPAPPAISEDCQAMVDGANAFLDGLQDMRGQASFAWTANHRTEYEFLPPDFNNADRPGFDLRSASAEQRTLFEDFLGATLSADGYQLVRDVRLLEDQLGGNLRRDPDEYYVSIYGEPNAQSTDPWGMRLTGHHLDLFVGIVACKTFSAGPIFVGRGSTDEVNGSPTMNVQVAAAEQMAQAVGTTGGNAGECCGEKNGLAQRPGNQGESVGDMTDDQKSAVREVIGSWLNNMNMTIAADRLAAIEAAGFDNIRVVNSGAQLNAFRIQGPTFMIQWGGGSGHVHSAWRDFDGDYGEDLIARHEAAMHAE